jgi:multiple sugar transport system permease protein
MQRKIISIKYILVVILFIVAILWIIPFFWMLSTSLKHEADTTNIPLKWIPPRLTFENYEYILFKSLLLRWLMNSIIIAVIVVVLDLFINSLAAFALARIKFPGRDLVFSIILATLMVPQQVTIVPLYLMINKLGLEAHI